MKPTVMRSVDFSKLVLDGNSKIPSSLMVRGDVHLDLKVHKALKHIRLDGIVFQDRVTISDAELDTLVLNSCNVGSGILFEHCKSRHLSISECSGSSLSFWHVQCQKAEIYLTSIDGVIDLSGFKIADELCVRGVEFSDMHLRNANTYETLNVPRVVTDNFLVAMQFRLMGVPVIMPTSHVRKLLESSPAVTAVV